MRCGRRRAMIGPNMPASRSWAALQEDRPEIVPLLSIRLLILFTLWNLYIYKVGVIADLRSTEARAMAFLPHTPLARKPPTAATTLYGNRLLPCPFRDHRNRTNLASDRARGEPQKRANSQLPIGSSSILTNRFPLSPIHNGRSAEQARPATTIVVPAATGRGLTS